MDAVLKFSEIFTALEFKKSDINHAEFYALLLLAFLLFFNFWKKIFSKNFKKHRVYAPNARIWSFWVASVRAAPLSLASPQSLNSPLSPCSLPCRDCARSVAADGRVDAVPRLERAMARIGPWIFWLEGAEGA